MPCAVPMHSLAQKAQARNLVFCQKVACGGQYVQHKRVQRILHISAGVILYAFG